jgi:hypothetical protein
LLEHRLPDQRQTILSIVTGTDHAMDELTFRHYAFEDTIDGNGWTPILEIIRNGHLDRMIAGRPFATQAEAEVEAARMMAEQMEAQRAV